MSAPSATAIVHIEEEVKPLDLNTLDRDTRKWLLDKEQELGNQMIKFGRQGLEVARELYEIRERLLQERAWVPWLKRMGIVTSTAYNLCAMWERSQGELGLAVTGEAIAQGIKIGGVTQRSPFGKYTDVVKLLPSPKKIKSREEAREWLRLAQEKLKEIQIRPPKGKRSRLQSAINGLVDEYMDRKKPVDVEKWLAGVSELFMKRLKDQQGK